MKTLLFILLFLVSTAANAQMDTIRLHFLYGSRPSKGFRETEKRVFGGIKGGHVSIELKGRVLDFMPGDNPLLPENNKPSGGFRINKGRYWDTLNSKWKMILVPITAEQSRQLDALFDTYSHQTPYDYAIFGMRCAAASYDVLSEIGLVKKLSDRQNIFFHFYPKLLRKKMFRWAEENHYTILSHDGKPSRKWESDTGIF